MAKSIEEQSKKEIAKRVITPTRKYFLPTKGVTVEAADEAEAVKKANKKDEEVGDVDA